MSTCIVPALCVAAALAVTPARPHGRIATTKHPRDGPPRATADTVAPHRMAADLDLFAACFKAGLPVESAAAAVADAAEAGDAWRTAATLTALGAPVERAWADMHSLPGGAEMAHLIALSDTSGAAVAAGCERIAARLREGAADRATARAERAGVLIAIPLTAFFLPAFFVLGLAPVVIGLAGKLF